MARRRSVMLDEEHAEMLRRLAARYGVPVSSYLRALVEAAWEAEERGLNAASALRRAVVFEGLLRLGAVLAPRGLLGCAEPGEAERLGRELGSLAARLGLDVFGYVSMVAERAGVGVAEHGRVVILPRPGGEEVVAALLLGMARGAGLRVRGEPGGVYVVEEPSAEETGEEGA